MNRKGLFGILGIVLLICAAAAFPACKRGAAPSPAAAGTEGLTIDDFYPIMGKADGVNSGIAELTRSGAAIRINYHMVVPEGTDMDAYIGTEITPKLRKLYDSYKNVDETIFEVETANPADPTAWNPYCSFTMTRKIYNQTNWTGLLARDLFKVCKPVKYLK